MKKCIVVADASRARILFRDGLGPVEEVDSLEHPEGRMHPGQLEEEGEGAQHESTKTTLRRTDPRTPTSEKYARRFAAEVAGHLRSLRTSGDAEQFILAAEPRFLGYLRESLDAPTADCVAASIAKDYGDLPAEELAKKLPVSS